MDKKVATSEDIGHLAEEFEGIEQNKNIQALGDKIAEIEKAYILDEKIKKLLAEFYNSRGATYHKLGEHDKAIKDYSRAIELKPDYARAHYNRGVAYDDLEKYKEAIKNYSRAIELRPDYTKAYYNRGNIYVKLEKHQKAIEDYNEAIKFSIGETQNHKKLELYRYQPINKHNLQALGQQELWLSSPKSFNDPLDGDYLYTLLTEEQKELKEALDGVVIASFQGPPEKQNAEPNGCQTLMWSHYGDSHRGICLQFAYQKPPDTRRLPSMLTKVEYDTERWLDLSSVKRLLLKGFAVKSEEWKYESEYRIISHEPQKLWHTENGTLRTYKELGLELKAIIFGLKCEQADRDIVRKLAPKSIGLYQIRQVENSFHLCCRPIEKECEEYPNPALEGK